MRKLGSELHVYRPIAFVFNCFAALSVKARLAGRFLSFGTRDLRIREYGFPCCPLLTTISSVRITEQVINTDATLTSKGQTTIPKPIRDSLRMKAGDKMSLTLMPDGVVIMQVKNRHVSDLAGQFYKKGRKPVPVELLSR